MMFAGQVNWINPADVAGQRALQGNVANGEVTETAFALVYEAVLGLSDDQCSESGESNNWLDQDGEGDLPETHNSSGMQPQAPLPSAFPDKDPTAKSPQGPSERPAIAAAWVGSCRGAAMFKSSPHEREGQKPRH